MNSQSIENAINGLAYYGLCLPLTLTAEHHSPVVRVVGLVGLFVWIIPAMIILGGPILLLILALMFTSAWEGEL